MAQTCPVCGLPFERSSGEITGGMGINISVTLLVVVVGALLIGLNPAVPLLPSLLALGFFALVFPIVFYRSSRGLWAGVLYLTGDNEEPD